MQKKAANIKHIETLASYWMEFAKTGVVPTGVRDEIARSWIRSRAHGLGQVHPGPRILPDDAFKKRLADNKLLMEFSYATIRKLYSLVGDTQNVISLHDKDGYLLDFIINQYTADQRDMEKFKLGVCWDEPSIGTNGVGLCIIEDKPIQVIGPEHYFQIQHYATCSNAPIHDAEGNLIGILNMSGELSKSNSHTLGLIASGAYAIENQIALSQSYSVINNTLNAISESLIVLDSQLNILKMSRYAATLLEKNGTSLVGRNICEFFCPPDFKTRIFEKKTPFSYLESDFRVDGQLFPFHISIAPILSEQTVTGVILLMREIKAINKVANIVSGNKSRYVFEDIITENPQMLSIINVMKDIALTDCTVLIEGESGTGKELFAHSIHSHSKRRNGPFIAINCASLPRSLVESELFGYEKGAFTGASSQGNPGKFELANGGTIFLDEIGELPLEIQATLLRVLDTGRIARIGAKTDKALDVRVLAATNRNLLEEVENSNFRGDLYYRINVLKFNIPPLRNRISDVILLANAFLLNANRKKDSSMSTLPIKHFDPSFMNVLMRYPWPGNVRELQNIVVRAYYTSGNHPVITSVHLPENVLHFNEAKTPAICEESAHDDESVLPENLIFAKKVQDTERSMIVSTIEQCGNDVLAAASRLNMSKSTLYRKISKYEINLSPRNGRKKRRE